MAKKRIATVWLCGCSGCHMSFLDLDEKLIDLAGLADMVASPVVDVKEIPECDVGIVEGAIANEENLHVLEQLRARCKVLVSLGDCAGFGCVPMLRNQFTTEEVLDRAYVEAESMALGEVPTVEVPRLLAKVRPIHEFVKVDAWIPGCPPSPQAIWQAVAELLGREAGEPVALTYD
ncbi:MAG: NADP oxidoreductase [Phycisphaerae bacterium]|jgi:NAD-reducing hydrogenase small subunit